ncbi:hypothetical protein COB64_00460 [Candidatus Wolfebacteria bacterium]|nr:MAG: hypothetical protein COB64_00460 [Candidatus Wolfebacteria bacterium]
MTFLHVFKKNCIISILVLLLLSWGIFLRFHNLGQSSYWMDEGYSVNAALSTAEKGYPFLDSGMTYDTHLPSTYAIAGSVKLFGESNTSTRLPSVIFNILFLATIFLFTKKFFGIKTALLTTLFLTFSYWEIGWARQARNYALFQLSFWLSLYFFWQLLYNTRVIKYVVPWIIFSFLTFFTHRLGLFLLPIYLISFVVVQWDHLKKNWLHYLFGARSIYVYIFTLLIFIIFGGGVWNTIKESLSLKIFYLPQYLAFIKNNFLLVIILALSSLALYFKNKLIRQKISLLLIVYIVPLVIISFFILLSGHRYLFPVLPALYILSALTFVYIWEKYRNIFIRIGISVAVVLMILFSKEFQFMPRTFFPLESNRTPIELGQKNKASQNYYIYTPQPDWNNAYSFIKERNTQDDIIISVQPVFNKLYLNDAGYWIAYSLSDKSTPPMSDFYVGAHTIQNLTELTQLTRNEHGFIILDFLSMDNRIEQHILEYIHEHMELVYKKETNYWSRIWIYRF